MNCEHDWKIEKCSTIIKRRRCRKCGKSHLWDTDRRKIVNTRQDEEGNYA